MPGENAPNLHGNKTGIEMIDRFLRRADYFQKYRDNPYMVLRLDLSIARDNFQIPRAGDLVKVIQASASTVTLDIKFNSDTANVINLFPYRAVYSYYEKVFITNTVQAGAWVDIVFAVTEWFDITDFQ